MAQLLMVRSVLRESLIGRLEGEGVAVACDVTSHGAVDRAAAGPHWDVFLRWFLPEQRISQDLSAGWGSSSEVIPVLGASWTVTETW